MKKIKKAIIPVGGEGTRMFPMTKAFPKEFLPLSDSNGKIKPAILYLINELDESGIEEIYIMVTKKYQKNFYENFFFKDVSPICKQNLNEENVTVLKQIKKLSKKIKIYYNEDIKGFGHVLYHCKNIINNEPFLLLLGDQIYKSYTKENCIKQIINNFTGDLTISAYKISLEDVNKYGIMSGDLIEENKFIINEIKEKPTKLYAKKHLPMRSKDEYYSVFGTYILNAKIINEAVEFFNNEKVLQKEYQLTQFLENYSDKKIAFIPNGKFFDIGNSESYNKTYKEFQKNLEQVKI